MTDIDHFAIRPCVRGCEKQKATDDQPPLLMGALHGHYCDRCYYRTDKALSMAAPIVEHILGLVSGLHSKVNDGSQRLKKDPPLPMNIDAFNDANETYGRLVYWTALFATRLNQAPPAPAARAWRTDNNRIVGLPADVAPAAARNAVRLMAAWLENRLEAICNLPRTDDTNYFHDEIKDLYRINARYPREDQPEYVPVWCWVDTLGDGTECKARVYKVPPQRAGDDEQIRCENGHAFHFDEFDRMASAFRQVHKEQARELTKAARTQARLNRKYAS